MSSHSQSNPGPLALRFVALVVALFFLGDLARAQEQPAPKWEIFGGYSFIYPNARLHAINPIIDANQEGNPRGLGASVTYNFNRWFGSRRISAGRFGEVVRPRRSWRCWTTRSSTTSRSGPN